MLTVYFQGVNMGKASISITILRQIILLVPLAWIFHFKGLSYVWLTFPVTELIALVFCVCLYTGKRPEDARKEKTAAGTYDCSAVSDL